VASTGQRPSRREQRRAETLTEIKARAMEQIAAGGVEGLSLSAVARAMEMAPAALYRYFDSKDDLLAAVVVDAYDSLATSLDAAGATPPQKASGRLVAVARAYRDWALNNPNAYRLIFQHSSGSGHDHAPEATLAAAQRSMDVFLHAIAPLHPAPGPRLDNALARDITRWGQRSAIPDLPVTTLYAGLSFWTRLHGLISLQLGHHLEATGIDPAKLYEAEIDALLSLTTASAPNANQHRTGAQASR